MQSDCSPNQNQLWKHQQQFASIINVERINVEQITIQCNHFQLFVQTIILVDNSDWIYPSERFKQKKATSKNNKLHPTPHMSEMVNVFPSQKPYKIKQITVSISFKYDVESIVPTNIIGLTFN